MDGRHPLDYREKFERLAKCKGEIVAIISDEVGEEGVVDEKWLLRSYEKAAKLNASLLDHADLKAGSQSMMDAAQEARAAIQAYKLEHNIPLDTPPVSETPPPREGYSANDDYYGADVLGPEF